MPPPFRVLGACLMSVSWLRQREMPFEGDRATRAGCIHEPFAGNGAGPSIKRGAPVLRKGTDPFECRPAPPTRFGIRRGGGFGGSLIPSWHSTTEPSWEDFLRIVS